MKTSAILTATGFLRKRHFYAVALGISAFLSIFALGVSSSAQTEVPVPPTVELKPGFVGAKYEFLLDNLVPAGAKPITWREIPFRGEIRQAPDKTEIEKMPAGIGLVDSRDDNGNPISKLIVAPRSSALRDGEGKPRTKPSVFELEGRDEDGNSLVVRFRIAIRPFGVDESKIQAVGDGSVAGFSPGHQKPLETPHTERPPFVLTTSTADEETVVLDQELENADPPVAGPDFSPTNQAKVLALIDKTVGVETDVTERVLLADGRQEDVAATNFQPGDYLLTHIIVWKPAKADAKSEARRELWGLFKAKAASNKKVEWEPQGDPTDKNVFNSRIFGGKRVAVLLIHFNTPANWDVKYSVALNQRIPTPIQNLLTLAKAATGGAPADGVRATTKTIWGARMILVRYSASDMLVKVNAITADDAPVEQAKDYSKKYLNEGRYHWDISLGLPIKSVKELEYKSEGNQVTTAAKERQSVYGFVNVFFKKVDLSGEDFLTPPHFVFGLPLATKPLHHPFAGLGYGVYKTPVKFNLFAGIVFNRERVPTNLNVGDAATSSQLESDLHTRWVRKFMFGINFPMSQIKDAIKK
ncbi:MAG TPA: hypothetical protein VLL54_19390 [Pyrinomonadaceae bacterium]|nr:hypothetical protein [Pyrinomonadaceae bacterium]